MFAGWLRIENAFVVLALKAGFIVLPAVFVISSEQLCHGLIFDDLHVVRLQRVGPVETSHGSFQIALLSQRIVQVVVSFWEVGLVVECCVVRDNDRLQIALLLECIAQVVVSL